MVAQPVAWYDKPGSPALLEVSSVSAMAMNAAMANSGEVVGAAAPGGAHRYDPFTAAAPATGATAAPTVVLGGRAIGDSSSPGHVSFAAAFNSGSPLERLASEGRWMRAQVAPFAMGVSTPPTRTSGTTSPPTDGGAAISRVQR